MNSCPWGQAQKLKDEAEKERSFALRYRKVKHVDRKKLYRIRRRLEAEVQAFLRSISHEWTASNYDLWEHNCNNFSEAVAQFLEERIHFLDIPDLIEASCERHKPDRIDHPQLDDVLAVDQWARLAVREQVARGTQRMSMAAVAA